jgi:anti-anti-sigma factor
MGTEPLVRREIPPWIRGPLITLGITLLIAGLDRYFWALPNPPAILVLVLVFSAYIGGVVSGLISAVLVWIFIALFFSISGRPFHYTDENLRRILVWVVSLPSMALMVGVLKRRTVRQLAQLAENEIRLQSVLDNIVDAVFTFDEHGVIESFNLAAQRLFGYSQKEAIGRDIATLLVPETEAGSEPAPGDDAGSRHLIKSPPGLLALPIKGREALGRGRDGEAFPVEIDVTEMSFQGKRLFIGTARDVRERKQAEEEQRRAQEEQSRLQEELIVAQNNALEELSTPLIPVRSKILVMPLVGTIDTRRAASVIEVLLGGINQHRAHSAIIDVTGVPVIDTAVAAALIRAANAAQMLGARVVLTGIRPDVAQTLVATGSDLRGVVTCRTLEQGIDFAETSEGQQRGKAGAPPRR